MGVFGLSVLVVVIVGGLDSVLGALVGGLFIGLVEALAGSYLGGEYKLLATFIVLVRILMVRPSCSGTHEIERLRSTLRRFASSPQGTPPLARQSRFHGGLLAWPAPRPLFGGFSR